eukprot:gnl/MRDRNA2_/MRDRNA2_102477_c0_seq1.p1 gnl/MRDRNA2_/MRDRNA2_102477_c0~~gnl/MRDRNA2_/MRDRNA2_102477_c0_seq1.p1  ORF type:complete len:815 (-),score=191.95 gnl/MRDRNA2_/MRDRNA2_102477_c0_seq1:156-2600(-)
MRESSSVPSLPRLPKCAPASGSRESSKNDGWSNGLSRQVINRMHLDATLAPSSLAMRANTANLTNESQLNNGKMPSTLYVLMKPRRNYRWEMPSKMPPPPPGYKEALERMRQEEERKRLEELAKAEKPVEAPQKIKQRIVLPPVEDPKVLAIFDDLKDDSGTIPRVHFRRALTALGHLRADKDVCEHALKAAGVEKDERRLSLEQVGAAITVFEHTWTQMAQAEFKSVDTDDSGSIGVGELRSLFRKIGFNPMPEAIDELKKEVDEDRSGVIEFSEFLVALRILRERHGFTKEEIGVFYQAFDKYDTDKSGVVNAKELSSILGWLRHKTSPEECEKLIEQVDDDGDGELNKNEFILVMRKFREIEIERYQSLFSEFDADQSGTISDTELRPLLQKLGYTLSHRVLNEIILETKQSKAGVNGLQGFLDTFEGAMENGYVFQSDFIFEDFWKVLQIFRSREGFQLSEVSEFYETFDKFDKNMSGEIDTLEFGRILAWLGYPSSPERRSQLWKQVDVDGSGCLDKGEFLKVLRLYREEEAGHLGKLFEEHGVTLDAEIPVSLRELTKALNAMGYAPPKDMVKDAIRHVTGEPHPKSISFEALLNVVLYIRETRVKELRQNAGLPDGDAAKIKKQFKRVDKDNSGSIGYAELEMFLQEMCPSIKASKGERARIERLFKAADDGSGDLSLNELLWLVRNFRDEQEEETFHKESEAVMETQFNHDEVQELREVFQGCDDDRSGFLSEKEVLKVVRTIMPISKEQKEALTKKLDELDEDGDRQTSFPEFLRLMRVVKSRQKAKAGAKGGKARKQKAKKHKK